MEDGSMARLDIDRQNLLQPKRKEYCKKKITELGYDIMFETDAEMHFEFKDSRIVFYFYTGWHTGKTIKDGRGIENLLKQI